MLNEDTIRDILKTIAVSHQQNEEFKKQILEQQEKILELSNKAVVPTNITNITNNTTTNTNNNINFNMFLEQYCKDAITIQDFIKSIKASRDDVLYLTKHGNREGVSKIISAALDQLCITERPIHCTDTKRETIYIKDRDKWTRDTENKEHTKKVIEKVANKNLNKIPEWRKQHPAADIIDSKEHDLNMQIMIQSLGGLGGTTKEKTERNHDKIVKMLAKGICVNKELLLESI